MKTKLGLRPEDVALTSHYTGWSEEFEMEKARLIELLDDLAMGIEHIGSTAVPDLCAKPIMDIAIAISGESVIDRVTELLLAGGYRYAMNAGLDGGHIFYRESTANVRTHHLHVVDKCDGQWANYLTFREALRGKPQLREEYARLKSRLAEQYANDRVGYTHAKTEFIRRVVHDADCEARVANCSDAHSE